MKIAFDVKGTIEGPDQYKVLKLFFALKALGHEMIVWSSEYSYAVRANKKHGLDAIVMSKLWKADTIGSVEYWMDLAIDDDSSQDYLASHKFLWVRHLPSMDKIDDLAKSITEGLEPDNDYLLP